MKSLLVAVAAAAVLAFWSSGGRTEVLIDGFIGKPAPFGVQTGSPTR